MMTLTRFCASANSQQQQQQQRKKNDRMLLQAVGAVVSADIAAVEGAAVAVAAKAGIRAAAATPSMPTPTSGMPGVKRENQRLKKDFRNEK